MSKSTLENFQRNVVDKYTIYNSLFSALPFSGVANVGALLPIFLQKCVAGYTNGKSPMEIIEDFFRQQTTVTTKAEENDRLFKFIQYIERQIVLFDAIEDAAFSTVHNVTGPGTLTALTTEAAFANKKELLKQKAKDFKIRLVLTAHPTQFYPGTVLGIIHDMGDAIAKDDFHTINEYIQQLGITPFFNKQRPAPYDEAVNLMWYLENILYQSLGNIYNYIVNEVFDGEYNGDNTFIELGFWPGGDRDGNPFVDGATTLKVASSLRTIATLCYYRDVRKLRRRLTFRKVEKQMADLERLLYENIFLLKNSAHLDQKYLLDELAAIRKTVMEEDHGLFVGLLDNVVNKIKLFGMHFASLDIRQDSRIHTKVLLDADAHLKTSGKSGFLPTNYEKLSEPEKIEVMCGMSGKINPALFTDITKDTLDSCYAIREIQKTNGEVGCSRYIISNCQSATHVMEVYGMLKLCDWKDDMTVDIAPLFETIEDLKNAEGIMEILYTHPLYRKHLEIRRNKQSIMLGFSDGTKDGGYLQANWSIYKAKENLSSISRKYGIEVAFFDGRGGPPSRGGGKTHQFYASMGSNIENKEIQLTIQGQTITSNFGTVATAQYNAEQLLSAGLRNEIFAEQKINLNEAQRQLMEELSLKSLDAYREFKANPLFLPYLQKMSPLNYYGNSNIASRPTKRNSGGPLRFEDLRAIPFVGSWSQLKQNVPGYFGLGDALQQFSDEGRFEEVQSLYKDVPFFKTLIDNSMMSMLKSFFALTKFVEADPEFGEFRKMIEDEFLRTKYWVLQLTGNKELMEKEPNGRESIKLRDKIVLPLLTIQQYALHHLHTDGNLSEEEKSVYEKMVTRSMFGIINAARNSA